MRNRAAGVYSQRPAELLRERAIYNTVYRLKSAALEDSFTTHTYKNTPLQAHTHSYTYSSVYTVHMESVITCVCSCELQDLIRLICVCSYVMFSAGGAGGFSQCAETGSGTVTS